MLNRYVLKFLLIFSITHVITACGSSGSGDATPKPDFNVMFSPSILSAELVETGATTWTVHVTVNGQVDGDVFVSIRDTKNVITTHTYIEQISLTQYRIILPISNTLTAGQHNGNINLHLCSNFECTKEYIGSPWLLPYSVSVESHTNLSNLTPIPNYQGWNSRFGNTSNTGYVATTLNPNQFSYRWFKRFKGENNLDQVVTEGNKIFFYSAESDHRGSSYSITAIDEWNGNTLWKKTFSAAPENTHLNRSFGLNVSNNLISIIRFSPPQGDTYFTALNTENGQTSIEHKLWNYSFGGSGARLDDDNFYMYGSFESSYSFASISRDNGTANWKTQHIDYDDLIYREKWLPTIDHQYIYIFNQHSSFNQTGLNVYDKETGEKVIFIADPNIVDEGELMPPILTNAGVLALNGRRNSFSDYFSPSLTLYDIENKKIKWSSTDSYIYQPVVANDVVYTVSQSDRLLDRKIEARQLETGELLWTKTITTKAESFAETKGEMIITDNILLVGSTGEVVAIDIESHEVVWEYPFGGRIFLTQSGVLIVTRDTSHILGEPYLISAITLKN